MRFTPVVLAAALLCACEGRAPAPPIGAPGKVDPKVIIREPEWVRKPTREEVAALRPAAAKDFKLSAVANMWCTAKADGTLDACQLDWQDPPGLGFGEAAMKTVPLWKMKTADRHGLVEGRPVEAQVTWPKP